MNAAKKKSPVAIVPPWLRHTVALLFGPGRTVTLAALVVTGFSGGAWAVWRHVEKHVENSREYLVSVEQITITPQPEWVRSDVRAEAFRTASQPDRPLSSLDDGLVQTIHSGLQASPLGRQGNGHEARWRQGECRHCLSPAGLHGGSCQRFNGRSAARRRRRRMASRRGLFAKAERVLPLPGRHRSPADPARGTSLGRCPRGRWCSDCRGALALLAATQALSHSAGGAGASPGDRGPTYELYTRAGTRITWGCGSGGPASGEPSAEEKVARLDAVRGGPWESRRSAAGCPQDPAGWSGKTVDVGWDKLA